MTYLDTSVALAHLLGESRRPPEELWSHSLVASRLLEYELWTRVNARHLRESHGDVVARLLESVALLDLVPDVLDRALEPFPVEVRTLDALHLASLEFLRSRGEPIRLATYDGRMIHAARAMAIELVPLGGDARD